MSEYITNRTIIVLIITLIIYIVSWRQKSLFHPGFYFVIIWLISVLSHSYLMGRGLAPTPAPKYIDELNTYVSFTSLAFLIWSFIGLKYVEMEPYFGLLLKPNIYKLLVLVSLAAILLQFVYSGASLNMGENRVNLVTDRAHVFKQYTIIDSLLSILTSFLPILTILSGFLLGEKQFKGKAEVKGNLFLLLPLICALLIAVIIGGRNPMAVAIKQFLLGYALSLPRHINKKESITALKILSIGIVFFAVFSTAVGNQRAKVTNQKVHEYENNIIRLSSGIIEYLTMHYWGYQLRRVDYTKDNLKYGVDTFYGFINIKVPFASQIGLEKGLPGLLGINHDPLEIYKSKRVGYYTTHSIYIQIISDFGPKGAYVFIALFTLYTQILFLRLISRPKFSAISFFMFYLCFTYWSSSNFSSAYGSNIINSIFIPFFLFDILQRVRIQFNKN